MDRGKFATSGDSCLSFVPFFYSPKIMTTSCLRLLSSCILLTSYWSRFTPFGTGGKTPSVICRSTSIISLLCRSNIYWEELGGDSLAGIFFARKAWCIWFPFLDPDDIKILSLGAIRNFGKWTVLTWAVIRLWGTKGPSIRPRCIGSVRPRTQCKSI